MMKTTRLVAILLAAITLGACIVEPTEEDDPTGVGAQPIDSLLPSGMDVHEAYRWYVVHDINPCDPPPDPWHPFVIEGYCTIDLTGP